MKLKFLTLFFLLCSIEGFSQKGGGTIKVGESMTVPTMPGTVVATMSSLPTQISLTTECCPGQPGWFRFRMTGIGPTLSGLDIEFPSGTKRFINNTPSDCIQAIGKIAVYPVGRTDVAINNVDCDYDAGRVYIYTIPSNYCNMKNTSDKNNPTKNN